MGYQFWGNSTNHSSWFNYFDFGNGTIIDDEFTQNFVPAKDVSVKQVVSSLYFNAIAFIFLFASYEILRRLLPSVYAARTLRRLQGRETFGDAINATATTESDTSIPPIYGSPTAAMSRDQSLLNLPTEEESRMPLDWIAPVFGVPWETVRKAAGLDGYFYLRFIRMCFRITSVSTFWAFIILVPVYAKGGYGAVGWYFLSMANISSHSWRMWIPTLFIYLFSGFVFFVMKQEYKHFLELRMDFLGKGLGHSNNLNPQHHFSIMVENIPRELRSNSALYNYFNSLFPGKVHSASVLLKLPDLEKLATKRSRVVNRLEKSIAYFEATKKRPSHVVGRSRMNILGITLQPLDIGCADSDVVFVEEGASHEKGTRVDSISYYTQELAGYNKVMDLMQKSRDHIAEIGASDSSGISWVENLVEQAKTAADDILLESLDVNDLSPVNPDPKTGLKDTGFVRADQMTASVQYGSFSPATTKARKSASVVTHGGEARDARLINEDHLKSSTASSTFDFRSFSAPGHAEKEKGLLRRMAVRLGLDFLVAGLKYANSRFGVTDAVVFNTSGTRMSSTGFVTFLDHVSVTCAASAPLTLKPSILKVSVAPEPREIRWPVANGNVKFCHSREVTTNVLLFFGVILWTFPLAAIQAFATAEQLARIPGMGWILTFDGGSVSAFVNGYLPVVALLALIMVLPFIFENVALHYERRKTLSDVQKSIVGRYFYYQLVNIYITVTAGSLYQSLADIIDHPSNVLNILGQSLPTMVGYFIALLITKIMAGLPMVFLRFGALSRMLILRLFFSEEKLTQRELNQVYRAQPIMYGWEYPSQLLVIVICFTYAVISPIILPFGALYFAGALVVYKKQLLYVYTPTYESGGTLFPAACDRALLGLICGQLTFIGYSIIRKCYYQPAVLLPLPFVTAWIMYVFRKNYIDSSANLSLERAIESDKFLDALVSQDQHEDSVVSGAGIRERRKRFKKSAYRQPVLTAGPEMPLPYRRGQQDQLTKEAQTILSANKSMHGIISPQESVLSEDSSHAFGERDGELFPVEKTVTFDSESFA